MIQLNPVTTNDGSVKRGLFSTDINLLKKLKCITFKEILMTDATMESGQNEVAKYFGVERQWEN
jgi:hypothetical protein